MTNTPTWPGWETVRIIGRGSFGAVYEIQRDVFGEIEKAALKVISIPQNSGEIEEMYYNGYDDESITSTFHGHLKSIISEYSLMRKMSGCTNIVNCEDVRYVQHDDGIGWDIFIKMELLTPLVKALPFDELEVKVIKLASDICRALDLCGQYDIVHRDIKPQNIFVSPFGDFKLGDFGIAKTVEKTMGGTKIGTYNYMAPEVYANQPYGKAADIYSLGLTLYWLLNERRAPFMPLPPATPKYGDEDKARQRRFSGEAIPAPLHGSEELKRIVMKACAFDPKERYSNAGEMLEELEAISNPTCTEKLVAEEAPVLDENSDATVGVWNVVAADTASDNMSADAANMLPIEPEDMTVGIRANRDARHTEEDTTQEESEHEATEHEEAEYEAAEHEEIEQEEAEYEAAEHEEIEQEEVEHEETDTENEIIEDNDCAEVSPEAMPQSSTTSESTENEASQPDSKIADKKKTLIIAAAVCCIAVIGLLLVLFLRPNDVPAQNDDLVLHTENPNQLSSNETVVKEETNTNDDHVSPVINTYSFHVEDCTWDEAFSRAIEKGGYLARFESREEFDFAISEIERLYGNQQLYFWLAGRRDADGQSYHWVDEDGNLTEDILNAEDSWCSDCWFEGEPSIEYNDQAEMYIEMHKTDDAGWGLNDVPLDIFAFSGENKGKIAYIVEYDEDSAPVEEQPAAPTVSYVPSAQQKPTSPSDISDVPTTPSDISTPKPEENEKEEIKLKSLSVKTMPNKTVYIVSQHTSWTGLTLTAEYSDGSKKVITSGFDCTPDAFLTTAGETTINVSYGGKTTSFTITVIEREVVGISMKSAPKTTYYAGESFDAQGTVLIVEYNDGSTAVKDSGFGWREPDLSEPGTTTVIFEYGGKTLGMELTVLPVREWSDWVTELPSGINSSTHEIQEKTQYSYRTVQDTWTRSEYPITTGWKVPQGYEFNHAEELVQEYDTGWYAEGESVIVGMVGLGQVSVEEFTGTQYRYCDILEDGTYGAWSEWQFESPGSSETRTIESRTVYRRVTKDKNTIYYYYLWSEWSSYGDDPIYEDGTTQVRTRTVYRYK